VDVFVPVCVVPRMGMIVRSMFARVVMFMVFLCRTMLVFVLVLVQVLVIVCMGVGVGMSFISVRVVMHMRMGVFVGMQVAMFMVAFHDVSLLSVSLRRL
jgi:hypothetical protein